MCIMTHIHSNKYHHVTVDYRPSLREIQDIQRKRFCCISDAELDFVNCVCLRLKYAHMYDLGHYVDTKYNLTLKDLSFPGLVSGTQT